MQISLKRLDPLPRSIYGYGNLLPDRMAYLHPAAWDAWQELQRDTSGSLVYSDVYRDAASILRVVEAGKRGVKSPGYSAHGYGLAFDLDVGQSLKNLGCSYHVLLDGLTAHDWRCHRQDGARGFEDWHFNFGPSAEAAITLYYPEVSVRMEPTEIQQALARLELYRGAIDGKLGPQSTLAAQLFASSWHCHSHGQDFERRLRFVAADVVIV